MPNTPLNDPHLKLSHARLSKLLSIKIILIRHDHLSISKLNMPGVEPRQGATEVPTQAFAAVGHEYAFPDVVDAEIVDGKTLEFEPPAHVGLAGGGEGGLVGEVARAGVEEEAGEGEGED